MNKLERCAVLAALVVVIVTGCATTSPGSPGAGTGYVPVWPQPPELPRIRFIETLRSRADMHPEDNILDSLFNLVIGRPEWKIQRPYGVTKDADGRIYVVDRRLRGVHVFDPREGTHTIFPDQPIEGFRSPIDIAVAGDGRIFVSDSESRLVHIFANRGKRYVGNFGTDQLERPTGLALNPRNGELIVCDTLGSRLAIYDPNSLKLKRIVGGKGDGHDNFNNPAAVAVGKGGRIYVTDSLNFRVQILGSDYRFIGHFGSAGDGPGHFSRPKGIATDRDGNVYVVDALFDNVQIFDPAGRLLMAFGSSGSKAGKLWLPSAIYIDPENRIYVADTYNRRVQIFERIKSAVQ